jgi:hypothetical protein
MSYLRFANGSGIMSRFQIKVYSFMTLVYIVRFNTLPAKDTQSDPFILWPSYPTLDFPTIFVVGKGNNKASIEVGSFQNSSGSSTGPTTNNYGCTSPPRSKNGPTVEMGGTYIITLRANRTDPSDIYSLNSLTVGAALLSDIQNAPNMLRESSPVVWSNRKSLDNPDSGASDFFLIRGDAGCQFDLFSLQMFDYVLSGANLGHVANSDWAEPVQGSSVSNENPYIPKLN